MNFINGLNLIKNNKMLNKSLIVKAQIWKFNITTEKVIKLWSYQVIKLSSYGVIKLWSYQVVKKVMEL